MKKLNKIIGASLLAGVFTTASLGRYFNEHGFPALRLPDIPLSFFEPCIDIPCSCDRVGEPGYIDHFGP
ncbi:MAG: hypothetical protein QF605_04075 [Rhodospirillales bacterium]|nr:hypothetical protein [Rhodospirillales bacterium]